MSGMIALVSGIAAGYLVYVYSKTGELEALPEPISMPELPPKTCFARTRPILPILVIAAFCLAAWYTHLSLTAWQLAVFMTFLLAALWMDISYFLIPDWLTAPVFAWAIVAATIRLFVPDQANIFVSLLDALSGACLGAGFIATVGWLSEVTIRRQGMGSGDVPLMAVIGVHLGVEKTWLVIGLTLVVGACLGSCLKVVLWLRRLKHSSKTTDTYLYAPLALFLTPAALFVIFKSDMLLQWWQAYVDRSGLFPRSIIS